MARIALTVAALDQPACCVARAIAQDRIRQLLEHAAQLEVDRPRSAPTGERGVRARPASDPESVHAFRVALRRLRAWLRALRPALHGAVTHGSRRRLRRFSRLAGAARDVQVQCLWLQTTVVAGDPAVRPQARTVIRVLGPVAGRAQRKLARHLIDELAPAGARLARELDRGHAAGHTSLSHRRPMSAVMAQQLRVALADLIAQLEQLRRTPSVELAHPARIGIKRLRYLMDVFDDALQPAAVLRRLTAMQDAFGELHDAELLERRVARVTRSRRRGAPLTAAIVRRRETAFAAVLKLSAPGEFAAINTGVTRLIRRLERRTAGRTGSRTARPTRPRELPTAR